MRILFSICMVSALFSFSAQASIFGEETVVLLQVVANQLVELDHLAENIGVLKDQRNLLVQLNEGIGKATEQLRSIETIVERSHGVDPSGIQSLSDLNRQIDELKGFSGAIQDLLVVKLMLCDQAVEEAGLQSDTAYHTGTEMVGTGSLLAQESQSASPGRAAQITASAASAQMLGQGVALQTLAQIAQLQAMSLDLQKGEIQRSLRIEQGQRSVMQQALGGSVRVSARARRSRLRGHS
jgi:hypothetical protein